MTQRRRKLDLVVTALQLNYGPRAIRRAGPNEKTPSVPRNPTSFTELDTALGGGVPQGHITEISGATTSGKLTLAAKTIAGVHHVSPETLAAWIDIHATCDPDYLRRCGIDLDRLLVVRPEEAHQTADILRYLVESNSLAVLVCDWTEKAELGVFTTADKAALAGALTQLAARLPDTSTALIMLTEPVSASPALASAAAVRILIQRERWITRYGDVRGYEGRAEVVKNRFGPVGGSVPLRITFNGTVHNQE